MTAPIIAQHDVAFFDLDGVIYLGPIAVPGAVQGIRAANVVTPEFAALAREHNDANVVALSGRFVDEETNRRILDAFLSTDFGGGRHAGRVEKIAALEKAAR